MGSPFGFFSGPGIPPMRARKDARRGLSPDFTGAFRFMPSALAEARPWAFRPPFGFLPAFVCQSGDLAMIFATLYADFNSGISIRAAHIHLGRTVRKEIPSTAGDPMRSKTYRSHAQLRRAMMPRASESLIW